MVPEKLFNKYSRYNNILQKEMIRFEIPGFKAINSLNNGKHAEVFINIFSYYTEWQIELLLNILIGCTFCVFRGFKIVFLRKINIKM